MKGPAFLLPAYTIADEELIGAAIVLAGHDQVKVYRQLTQQAALIQATVQSTDPVTIIGPQPTAWFRFTDLDPKRQALLVQAAQGRGCVLLADASLLDADEENDLLRSHVVTDLDMHVASAGFYWTAILREADSEEIGVGTGLIDLNDLDHAAGPPTPAAPRTDVGNLIDAAASVTRWYESMRPIDGPGPLFDLKAAVGNILGKPLADRNDIQYARLLAEVIATQDQIDMEALSESMDLSVDEVDRIFSRAQTDWALIAQTL